MVNNIKNYLIALYKFGVKKIKIYLVILLGLSFSISELQSFTIFFIVLLIFESYNEKNKVVKKISLKKNLIVITLFLPVLIIVNVLSGLLLSEYTPQDSVIKLQDSKIENILVYVMGILILTPLIEELYFRKLLLLELCNRVGCFWGLIISSFYFSTVHLNILAFPTLFILGLILGLSFLLSKSFLWPFILHAVFNLIMFFSIKLL